MLHSFATGSFPVAIAALIYSSRWNRPATAWAHRGHPRRRSLAHCGGHGVKTVPCEPRQTAGTRGPGRLQRISGAAHGTRWHYSRFLVTWTTIGAGALGAVVLLFLYPLRLTSATLAATDLARGTPLRSLPERAISSSGTSTSCCWANSCSGPSPASESALTWAASNPTTSYGPVLRSYP